MNLRKKIWLVLAVTLAGVLGPLFLLFAYLLGNDFDRLAGELARLHVRRVVELVAHQQRTLGVLATDWGEWDDAYTFVADHNQAFVDSNITPDINQATETDLILILDNADQPLVAAATTRAPMVGETLARRATEALVARNFTAAENEESLSGLVSTSHGALMFGASPILSSANEGPNRGAMVMARLIDPALLKQWQELLQGKFALFDWNRAAEELSAGEIKELTRLPELISRRGGEMVGYGRLLDVDGNPAYLIRVEPQQAVYAQGRITLEMLSALLFAALALFAVTIALLLKRSLLSRLERLDRAVGRMGDAEGEREVRAIAAAADDELGRLAGSVDAMVGELSRSLREKEVLLREIHHRVKNNMQVISSLLNMQADGIDDPHTCQALRESRDRVRSMALVHEKLYRTEQFSRLDFAEYLRSLTAAIARSSGALAERVEIRFELEPVELELDTAVYCGLVTNELITNAFEHAYPGGRAGVLRIALRRAGDGAIELVVADDGCGLPEELAVGESATLGLRLVTNLVERQLGGELRIGRDGGSRFHIRFHEPERRPNSG
ncbi:sensor histidine kinase [Endothiovibrio diazotrophicus]